MFCARSLTLLRKIKALSHEDWCKVWESAKQMKKMCVGTLKRIKNKLLREVFGYIQIFYTVNGAAAAATATAQTDSIAIFVANSAYNFKDESSIATCVHECARINTSLMNEIKNI